ncbi:hypothetical protein [Schumannella sp. 10F1B-5-1]|uniref:hypothetical protein n=1 Tax=Schumannella sp. 10F1B-5-1 TaxID=2590780 RepID=UPI00113154D1|nr:hypothetical protein [Schumannella sp. 10F1B-5-1]TPW71711.1 hypothetical protein FJ658_10230 [Schumannella sp. 10F1B-5-1]
MSDAASPENGARRRDDESAESAETVESTGSISVTEPETTSLGAVDAEPAEAASSDEPVAESDARATPQWTQEVTPIERENPDVRQDTAEAAPVAAATPTLVEPAEPVRSDASAPLASAAHADLAEADGAQRATPTAATSATAPVSAAPAGASTIPAESAPTTGANVYPTGAQPLPAVDHEAFSSFLATDDVTPPKPQHNRLFGAGFALLSSLVFGALYGGVVAGLLALRVRPVDWMPRFLDFVTGQAFVVPVVAYVIVAVIFALLLNRAHWFAHVVLSLILGALVYAGSVVTILLLAGVTGIDSAGSRNLLVQALTNPSLIAAGLVAREVAMWFGFIAAARGRKVVARNREARERFDRDQQEKKAQRERGYVAV